MADDPACTGRALVTAYLELETSLFCRKCSAHKFFRASLLCHQGIAEPRHDMREPGRPSGKRRRKRR